MKTFTTIAVIAALTIAAQAFAMGGSSRAGQSMPSTMPTPSMNTGSKMTIGTTHATAAAPMSGSATTTAMSATGTTKTQTKSASLMQPTTVK